MSPISLLVFLVIVGVLLYAIERVIPMDGSIKLICRVVILLFVLFYLLKSFGLLSGIHL